MAKLINSVWKTQLTGNEDVAQEIASARENPATDTVRLYFSNIRRFPLLTIKEERQLARRVSRGDKEARRLMIESNLRLVVNLAKRYLNRGFQLQDLIEEGNIGLIKSVERFKASKGCRFSTYATYWIKQSIERAIANQSNIIRLPVHITADLSKISRAAREIRLQYNREPTVPELSTWTGLSGRYVKKLDNINQKSCSLDASMQDGSEQTLLERIPDESFPAPTESIDEARRLNSVKSWLAMLDENEKEIIRLRFGLFDDSPQTLESIGRIFGITRERVRQIEVKALAKLRRIIRESPSNLTFDVI